MSDASPFVGCTPPFCHFSKGKLIHLPGCPNAPQQANRGPPPERRCAQIREYGQCADWRAGDSQFCSTHRGPVPDPQPEPLTRGEFFYVIEMPDGGWTLTARGVICGEA